MSKKIFPITILIFLILIKVTFGYTDIENHWAEESIEKLSKINLINGYSDETFRPDSDMTRAELITIVNRMLKNTDESSKYIPDNDSKSWYYQEIRKALESGIINGDENGNANPESKVTRQEAIAILSRAFLSVDKNLKVTVFSDSKDIAVWAMDYVGTFVKYGYLKGYSVDNTIRPKSNITRAEIVTIISRLFNEVVISGEYKNTISGNVIINGENVKVIDTIVKGNVLITEGTKGNVEFKNTTIDGNLVLRTKLDVTTLNGVDVKGDIINLYESISKPTVDKYLNNTYGISFSVPQNLSIVEINNNTKIDYTRKNLMTIKITEADDLHFKTFNSVSSEEMKKYANIYTEIENEKIVDYIEYGVYKDETNTYLMIIKRYNIVYTMYFYNIENYNIVDNVINSIELTNGENVADHSILTYKNSKLSLKFRYLDYIGVDDSYNTSNVFEGDTYFKLFIQVNKITDLGTFSIEDIKDMLIGLASKEGEVLTSNIRKIKDYDSIEITVQNSEKVNKYLYIIVNNMMYTFIFNGKQTELESIGSTLFEDVISTIEI